MAAGRSMPAQTPDADWYTPLRHPGWNYGGQTSGGFTAVQVSSPNFLTVNRNITNFALAFHLARVLTDEHGNGCLRGSLEWDFNVIPVEIFWVLGSHYAGGFEALGPRWNFTGTRRRVIPFAGIAGGMLFSPENFPPGNTYQSNFTIALARLIRRSAMGREGNTLNSPDSPSISTSLHCCAVGPTNAKFRAALYSTHQRTVSAPVRVLPKPLPAQITHNSQSPNGRTCESRATHPGQSYAAALPMRSSTVRRLRGDIARMRSRNV
jgi:hypothetical protein